MSRYSLGLLALFAALAGCERPLVDLEPASVAETVPDLAVVQTQEFVPLQIRVTDADGVRRITVNGQPASPTSEPAVFLDTLRLEFGLNAVLVAVYDQNENVTVDTLYTVLLPYQTAFALPPPDARYEHTATRLADGSVLVAGGFVDGRGSGAALLVRETGGVLFYTPLGEGLNRPRIGHTATPLPDGRVLFLGGATRDAADEGPAFVAEAELYDPFENAFTVLPQVGEPLRRYEHAAVVLPLGERLFVYVYGGLEPAGDDAAATGTLAVFELREERGVESLVAVSPPGGLGAFPPAYAHALFPLPAGDEAQRALTMGAAVSGGEARPFAQRFLFRPSSTFFPFEVTTEPVAAPATALGQFGAAPIEPALVFLSGGGPLTPGLTRTPSTDTLRVYADEAGRFFTFPEDVRLRVARSRHTATLLPSGRTLLLGGVGPDDPTRAIAQAEVFGPN